MNAKENDMKTVYALVLKISRYCVGIYPRRTEIVEEKTETLGVFSAREGVEELLGLISDRLEKKTKDKCDDLELDYKKYFCKCKDRVRAVVWPKVFEYGIEERELDEIDERKIFPAELRPGL